MAQQIEPTKSNCIRLKEELHLAEEGYEILDHKREILLKELSEVNIAYAAQRKELIALLNDNFTRYTALRRVSAPRFIAYASIPQKNSLILRTASTGVMGLHLPKFSVIEEKIPFKSAPLHAAPYEEFILELKKMVSPLTHYAELFCALRRISYECARTQKRQKALENIHIPYYREGITFITAALEESEREELVRYKKLKKKLAGNAH